MEIKKLSDRSVLKAKGRLICSTRCAKSHTCARLPDFFGWPAIRKCHFSRKAIAGSGWEFLRYGKASASSVIFAKPLACCQSVLALVASRDSAEERISLKPSK
jgi:hypothetical protein